MVDYKLLILQSDGIKASPADQVEFERQISFRSGGKEDKSGYWEWFHADWADVDRFLLITICSTQ
jgi:hypothetical protein